MEFVNALKTQALANPLAAVSAGIVLLGTYKVYRIVDEFATAMYELTEVIDEVAGVPRRRNRNYSRYVK